MDVACDFVLKAILFDRYLGCNNIISTKKREYSNKISDHVLVFMLKNGKNDYVNVKIYRQYQIFYP